MEAVRTIINEIWHLMLELSPWLMVGMFIAGLLHVLLPQGFVKRHFGGKGFLDVLKAVAVGVPMPLCSCGVIPAATGLKKDGASTGASIGFLISTPQTGVDSILVCATFLGWPFAIFKVASALVSGLIGGVLVNLFDKNDLPIESRAKDNCCSCSAGANLERLGSCDIPNDVSQGKSNKDSRVKRQFGDDKTVFKMRKMGFKNSNDAGVNKDSCVNKLREAFHFAFITLLRDIYRWLIIGVIIAAMISTFIKDDSLRGFAGTQGIFGMLAMLVISLPMYVCATASVPLAASLIAAGMSPGSALVFLMAGPTTNVATIGVILRTFGKITMTIYLATVVIFSIAFGLTFDWLLSGIAIGHYHIHALPSTVNVIVAAILSALIFYLIVVDLYKYLNRHFFR